MRDHESEVYMLEHVATLINKEMNAHLISSMSTKEIKNVVFSFIPNKALGLD